MVDQKRSRQLESTGDGIGDTIENIPLIDQCGDDVDIDFYGEYTFCTKRQLGEVVIAGGRSSRNKCDFVAETGVDFVFIRSFSGRLGLPATAEDCAGYAGTIGNLVFQCLPTGKVKSKTRHRSLKLSPVRALTPSMEILYCDSGHGSYDGIRCHTSTRRNELTVLVALALLACSVQESGNNAVYCTEYNVPESNHSPLDHTAIATTTRSQ